MPISGPKSTKTSTPPRLTWWSWVSWSSSWSCCFSTWSEARDPTTTPHSSQPEPSFRLPCSPFSSACSWPKSSSTSSRASVQSSTPTSLCRTILDWTLQVQSTQMVHQTKIRQMKSNLGNSLAFATQKISPLLTCQAGGKSTEGTRGHDTGNSISQKSSGMTRLTCSDLELWCPLHHWLLLIQQLLPILESAWIMSGLNNRQAVTHTEPLRWHIKLNIAQWIILPILWAWKNFFWPLYWDGICFYSLLIAWQFFCLFLSIKENNYLGAWKKAKLFFS